MHKLLTHFSRISFISLCFLLTTGSAFGSGSRHIGITNIDGDSTQPSQVIAVSRSISQLMDNVTLEFADISASASVVSQPMISQDIVEYSVNTIDHNGLHLSDRNFDNESVATGTNMSSPNMVSDDVERLAGRGLFFDMSHYYQPWVRHDVVDAPRVAPNKQHQYGAYIGIGGNQWQFDTASDQGVQLSGYEVQFGARTNDYFGLEFRLGKTNEGSKQDETFGTIRVKLDHMISVFARPSIALAPSLRLHGILGYSSIKRTVSTPDAPIDQRSDKRTGLSYGAGIQWTMSPLVSVTLDYLTLYEDDDESAAGVSFGLQFIHR